MKKIILSILILGAALTGSAQNATQDRNGNYIALKTSANDSEAKSTGKTFTDTKGIKYSVMISSRGKLYYNRTSQKTGSIYKCYIKVS